MWNKAQFLHNLSPFLYRFARVDPQERQIGTREAGQKHPEGRKPPDKRKKRAKRPANPNGKERADTGTLARCAHALP